MATSMSGPVISGLEVRGPINPGFEEILTPEAMAFLAELEGRFGGERLRLLNVRTKRQALLDQGHKPDFPPETRAIRDADWTISPLPVDLLDRRVEITGPVDRKMVINALNSGAKVFMADYEDATCPTWTNLVEGQINIRDAVRRTITHEDPVSGKKYRLGDRTAVLKVRPRGWHLEERHVLMDGEPMSGALFDFGLHVFHNAHELLARGSGPYFYLPKLESHFEARLWREVFLVAEEYLHLPHGSIKATVLIETILAAFEMDEILYELREHSAGLNCGRWDYIFSFIKKFRKDPAAVMPDRAEVTMATPFLSAYSQLAIRTCHRRGAPAIGGMAAFIPVKDNPEANEVAFSRVRADKEREASNGHDGTWVAHPGLVPVAREVFDAYMPTPNQIARKRTDVTVTAADLLAVPAGPKTEAGLRNNVAVGIGYIEAWLRGQGCVPLFNLMEDAATAEISRTQVWQWVHTGTALDDSQAVTLDLIDRIVAEELSAWETRVGADAYAKGRYADAASLFRDLVAREDFTDFLTLPAYERVVAEGA
ncbi:malate synthase A [Azospirillum sp. 11R-A]|uniref:malate synthase A n=1 Tax=Azospirillum sp. 11R-A TaxID=3111634 RepID=UPI003C1A3D64